jgi:hypothetical protein
MCAKLFAQILDSSIAEDYRVRHIFQDLLILADPDGQVDMTKEAVARRLNIPMELLTLALTALMSPDRRSRSPDEAGRRLVPLDEHRDWGWRIVNYKAYNEIKSESARRDRNRRCQAAHRARLKAADGVSAYSKRIRPIDVPEDTPKEEVRPPKAQNAPVIEENKKKNTENAPDEINTFEKFWKTYPRKVGKGNAERAWTSAVKKATPEAILAALKNQLPVFDQRDKKFVPHPATWLNGQRWEDDVAAIDPAEAQGDPYHGYTDANGEYHMGIYEGITCTAEDCYRVSAEIFAAMTPEQQAAALAEVERLGNV